MGNWREKEKLVVNIKPKEGKLLENNLTLIKHGQSQYSMTI